MFHRSHLLKRLSLLIAVVVAGFALVALAIYMPRLQPEKVLAMVRPAADARQAVADAWRRAQDSGVYHFTADILQTRTPLPTPLNAGRQSQEQALHLEGQADLSAGKLEFSLWSDDGQVLGRKGSLEVRIEGDQASGRWAGGEWQPVDDFSGLFAPSGDFLAYLAAAQDITALGPQTVGLPPALGGSLTADRYAFRLDGLSFARYLKSETEKRMIAQGDLPNGMELELPTVYKQLTGDGELWVDDKGLPLRQVLHIRLPDTDSEQVRAEVEVIFSEFAPAPSQAAFSLQRRIAQELPGGIAYSAGLVFCLLLVAGRRRKLYPVVAIAIVLALVATPLLQGAQASGIARRQASRVQAQQERQQAAQVQEQADDFVLATQSSERPGGPEALDLIRTDSGLDSDGDGFSDIQEIFLGSNPALAAESPSSANLAVLQSGDDGTDTDGDGLTDYQEKLLGTSSSTIDEDGDGRYDGLDSDDDGVDDNLEVRGFTYNGQTWYTDPLQRDTNSDGVEDGREWYTNQMNSLPGDTDGDGTPDLFDQDNDGDGVDDRIDLSPYQSTKTRDAFTDDAPFSLQIDNLEPGLPTYVEFQLRPTNPQHLWYAFNVFNWPEDNQGQIQDTDDATFYEVCLDSSSNDPLDCDPTSPNANGDLKLIPMLEIRFSGEPDNLPDEEVLSEMYGVSIQPLQADGSEKAAYVPLQLVSNSHDGARQAFYAKMFYLPTGAWNPQQVRLVWALQGLVDECLEFEDGQCSEYGKMNQAMIVHTYYDDWYLTGLNVREDHGQQTAVVWEDPQYDTNLNDDNELIWLTQLMEDNYFQISDLNGDGQQDLTPELIYTYFNHTTNSDVWDDLGLVGMVNNLRVEYRTYTHQDEAVQNVSVEVIPEILAGFVPYWEESPFLPTLLIASHDAFRANNLDAFGQSTSLAWDESDPGLLKVDIRYADGQENPVLTTASARWQPYQYDGIDWEPCPIEDYWAELEARYKLAMSELDSDPTVVQGMLLVFQYYYLALYNGLTAVIDLGSDAMARLPVPEMGIILSIASVGGSLAVPAVKFVVNYIMGAYFTLNARFIAYYLGTVEKYYAELSVENMNPGIPDRLKSFFSDLQEARYNCPFSRIRVAGNIATLVMILAIIVGGPLILVGNILDNRALVVAGTILVAIGLTILTVILPCLCLANMAKTMAGTTLQIMGRLLRSSGQVLGNSRVAGAVGAVISAMVSIFFFIIQVAQGGLNVVQVCQLIAYLIGQLIMVIVNFVLTLTVIGTIISAILGVIDMILSCLGLGDYTTASLVAKFFYGYSIITMPGIEVGNLDPTLLNVDRGMAAGELLQVSLEITATATMTDPQDWRTEGYIWTLWTEKQLRKTTVKTSMSQDSEIISVGPSQMEDDWQVSYDRTYHKKDFYKGEVRQDDSVWFTLQAGINTVYPFYLNMGYSLRLASCWTVIIPPGAPIPICTPEDIPGNTSTLVGDVLVFDVFPATLDEFFSLEWGDFGVQVDQDGDSLADRLLGGSDPDPTSPDADGDGLPDPYEVLLRYTGSPALAVSPLAKDTDGDGLCDADEVHLGTFPNLADSDLDGLTDGQEVFHQNCTTGAWSGGWLYTYGESGQQTRVTSDPLISDTDGDGQDDKTEFSLKTNPRRPNPSPVQLEAAISDPDHILGPGQTAVYTVTVVSNLVNDPPFYYQGGVTTTLPALLGGGQVNGSVNLPQGESLPLTWSIKANNTATTGDVSLNATSSGFLHDGDLNWYYEWVDPNTSTAVVSGTAFARLAAVPEGQNPFGVAAVDSTPIVTYRQAGTQFATPVEMQQDSLYIGDGPGPRLNPPALACRSDGVCLPVFADRAYDPNASIEWQDLYTAFASDCCDANIEPYVNVNGERAWSLTGVYGSTGMYRHFWLTGFEPTPFNETAVLKMYEADPVSSDDYVWGNTLKYYDSCESSGGRRFSDPTNYSGLNNQCYYYINKTSTGVDLTAMLFAKLIYAYREAVHGRLVNDSGALQGDEVRFTADFLPQSSSRPQPAVASDGSAFLQVSNNRRVEWTTTLPIRMTRYNTLVAQQISVNNGEIITGTVKELASTEMSTGLFATPAVVWMDGRQNYLVAYHRIIIPGVGDRVGMIELKMLDRSGTVLYGYSLSSSANYEQQKPALAYNTDTGGALLVYLGKQRYVTNPITQVFAELVAPTGTTLIPNPNPILLGEPGSGETDIASVSVAYEPVLKMWVVSWQATDADGQAILHLVALDKDGHRVNGKIGMGPDATHPATEQTIQLGASASSQNVACSLAALQRGQCAILSGMENQLRLDTLRLGAISPNQGNLTAEPADLPLWIDADKPTAGFDLTQNGYYAFSDDVIISGHAEDPGTHPAGVSLVQVNTGSGWKDASGTASWAYSWTVPATDGQVTLQVRAIDAAGNTGESTSLTVYLDRTPPQAGVNSAQVVAAQKVKDGWQVALSGTASDGGSGLQSVEVLVSPDGDGWQPATLDGGSWSLNYALSSFDAYGHVLSEPSGDYTIQVRATDAVGNVSTPTSSVVTIDTSPPVVGLSVPNSATTVISDTISISGVLTDTSTNQLSLEIAYNPAGGSDGAWTPVTDIVADQAAKTAAWSSQVPAGLEGNYTIALQASDVHGNKNVQPRAWEHWRGEIDTLAPRAGVNLEYLGAGSAAQTRVTGWVEDFSLALSTIDFACPTESAAPTYYADPWWLENTGGAQRLYRLDYACTLPGHLTPTLTACDTPDRCTTVIGTVPEYTSPAIAAAILSPAGGTTRPDLSTLEVSLGANAEAGLSGAALLVDGVEAVSQTWDCNTSPVTTDATWTAAWTPTDAGTYTLDTNLTACDGASLEHQTPITIQVDTDVPALEVGPTAMNSTLASKPLFAPIPVVLAAPEDPPDFTVVLNAADRLAYGLVALTGTVSDDGQVASVEVFTPQENAWLPAELNEGYWRYLWHFTSEPDGETFRVEVRATDRAGHTSQVSADVTVDLLAPAPVDWTLEVAEGAGYAPLTPGTTLYASNPTLKLSWDASQDGSESVTYRAGWTTSPDPDPSALTDTAGELFLTSTPSDRQKLYAHLWITDANGNLTSQSDGPVFLDTPLTGDLVADLDYHGWTGSGCTLVGADREPQRNTSAGAVLDTPQRLYATWDESALRLAWSGADWDEAGDLFIYLGTGQTGTQTTFDPYNSGPAITLPFAADALIFVEDRENAGLYRWNGSSWALSQVLDGSSFRGPTGAGTGAGGRLWTDLLIPWSLLDSPASLDLLGLASEETALRLWAAVPDKNPLNSPRVTDAGAAAYLDQPFTLTQSMHYAGLGADVCPSDQTGVEADLYFRLASTPPGTGAAFLGDDLASRIGPSGWLDADGDGQPDSGLMLGGAPGLVGPAGTIAYTLYYSNTGSAPAPGVTLSLTPHGGLALDGDASLDLGEIPAGGGGSRSFTAHIDQAFTGSSAELRLQAADTRHGPFEWLWSLHPVDNQPPSGVQIRRPEKYFRPGPVTLYGVASDPSGVPQVELKAGDGTPWTCTDSTPLDGVWSCAWDASSYTTDGQQVSLTARASDPFYHWSGWSDARTLTVDTVAPSVQLSSASQAALADKLLLPSELILSGTVTDGRQAAGVKICAETTDGDAALCRTAGAKSSGGLLTASWELAVPVLGDGDGVLENIKVYGLDAAGNASTSPLVFDSIRVDVTGPVLQVTTHASYAFQAQKITVLAGTIRDGSGVNALRLRRIAPDGALAWIPLTIANGAWKYETTFTLPGSYTFSLEAVDQHGNTTRSGLYQLTVYRSDEVADLSVSLAAVPTPAISGLALTYAFTVKNAGPGPAPDSMLVVDLPTQVTWTTLPEGCTNTSGQQVTCTLGTIVKDAQVVRNLAVTVKADATTSLVCKAGVSTTGPELNKDNNNLPLLTPLVQPVAGLTATATSPTLLGTATTFTAMVTAGTGVVYNWDFGDGEFDSGQVVTHLYAPKSGSSPGSYTATVTAHNQYNSLDDTVTVELGSRPPVLDLTGQSQIMFEDEPVQIARLSFSDPDQPDSHTATIDWGDGSGRIPVEVKSLEGGGYIYGVHTYPEPGVYTVTVVVTDSYGESATGSFTVTVINGFMRTCAYAGSSNPGVTVYPDARLDCPWTPAGPDGEVRASGVGSYYELYVRDRAVVSGTLASQTGDIVLFPDVQVITSTAGTEFNLLSSGDVFAGGKAEARERSWVGGNLTSGDSVFLLTDSYIAGAVTATGVISISPGAVVGGVISPDTPVPPLPEVTQVSFSFEPGKKDVTVGKGKTYTLKPGEYDDLKVGDTSILELSAGHYTFNTITVSKNARLELDLSGGPILIDVVKYISLADSVQMEITSAAGRPEDILVRLMGNNLTLGSGGVYLGTFLAPWASAVLGDNASLTGAIYGGKVNIFFNALVTGRPARDLFADTFVNPAILP